jgi:hypothetical protein
LERIIHLQRRDGHATGGRQTEDPSRIALDLEVFLPTLSARIKEANIFTRHLIDGVKTIAFEEVARAAGQRQV